MEHDDAHLTVRETGIPSGAASNRRRFLERAFLASIGGGLANGSFARDLASAGSASPRFLTTTRCDGRWWFLTPAGEVFWSIGLNHVDPATLRYLDSGVWAEKYGNSMERWLAAVKQDLSAWRFNTLDWNQELVTWNDQNRRHSRSFTPEEYQWLDLPYRHLLMPPHGRRRSSIPGCCNPPPARGNCPGWREPTIASSPSPSGGTTPIT